MSRWVSWGGSRRLTGQVVRTRVLMNMVVAVVALVPRWVYWLGNLKSGSLVRCTRLRKRGESMSESARYELNEAVEVYVERGIDLPIPEVSTNPGKACCEEVEMLLEAAEQAKPIWQRKWTPDLLRELEAKATTPINSRGLTYPARMTQQSAGSGADPTCFDTTHDHSTSSCLGDDEYIERNWSDEKPERIRRIERIMAQGIPEQRRPEGIPAEQIPAPTLVDLTRTLERVVASANKVTLAVNEMVKRLADLIADVKLLNESVADPFSEERSREEAAHVERDREPTTRAPDPASHTEGQSGTAGQSGVG